MLLITIASSYVTTTKWLSNKRWWYVPSGWNKNSLSLFLFDKNNIFDLDLPRSIRYAIRLTRVSRLSIMLEREREKMSGFSFRDSPKLTRVEITTSTRMKTRYTHSRIKRLINSVYDYLEIQQWNSPMIAIFFNLSLSFSLPIARYFLVAIKGRREIFFIGNFFIGRNKCCEQESRDISHFNIGEITSVSFLRVILINLLQQIDLRKNCIYIYK